MWIYNDQEVVVAPDGAVGFIYLMTNIETGRKYIGKKYLYSERKVNMGKKEIAALQNKRLKKWKVVKKDSDWQEYNSSCDEIKAEIKAGVKFDKQIICWTYSKLETYYLEVKYQFQNNVLESDEWYNKNIASKWFKGNLK